MNEPLTLPAAGFLASGTGRVLDIGCGAGRTTLMVALARPRADVVALDNFSADYISDHGAPHIMRNMAAAGVDRRVTIEKADMLRLPFRAGRVRRGRQFVRHGPPHQAANARRAR